MAQRRMFSKKITKSARFLRMPSSTQNLYFHLGLEADDDGVVEAFTVLRITGATEDDLRVLAAKDFIVVLNEDLVSFITDWTEHNKIRADRKVDTIYKDLLIQMLPDIEIKVRKQRSDVKNIEDNQWTTKGQPKDGIGKVRLGKDRLGKDRLDEVSLNQNSENNELKESSKTNNNDNKPNPLSFYENNGFGTLSPIVRDKIEAISKDFIQEGSSEQEADELIIKALELSAINNVRKWSYAEKVLINWNNKGHKTVKDVDAAEKNYQSRKGNNSYNQLNKTTPEEDEETKEFVRRSKERLAKEVAKYKPEDFDDFF
ncbi:DnaD domain protein [Jeotgalibaca sp. MA1X17-3]|uniref:DnaD domain-containing protein n=1 Tax=Jeotgalibaca sp. MA1X17-3 TaxID=2908211 RepID=UPI001F170DB2|nr:DnaD domain protein [Jeotgalibaca sp. MA1X17-3]UJF14993.1 DnaD domain protein [Jeotgalibaca sp. MA1X17-3]